MTTDDLLQDRQHTHGSFECNAIYAQELRSLWRSSPEWLNLPPVQREALDNMATKFSRILSGQGSLTMHWEDVAGYAQLALKACRAEPFRQVADATGHP